MQKKIKVSVLVPVYNEQEFIVRALKSIIANKIDFPIEILIGNDCSTDNTLDVATTFQKQHPGIIRIINNEENIGNGRTFVRLLQEAQGEYIHVLDADDYWTNPHKLKTQVDFLDQNPDYAIVAHNTECIYSSTGERISMVSPQEAQEIQSMVTDAKVILLGEVYFHTSSLLYRNVYKDQIPAFLSHKLGGGDVIRLRIHALHGKLKYFNETWSVYNYTGKGIWSSLGREEQLYSELAASCYWVKITPLSKKIFSWVCFSGYYLSYAIYHVDQRSTFKARLRKGIALTNLKFFQFIIRTDIFKRGTSKILHKAINLFYPLRRKFTHVEKAVADGKFEKAAFLLDELCMALAYSRFFHSLVFAGPVPASEIAKYAYATGKGILAPSGEKNLNHPYSALNNAQQDSYVILTSGFVLQGGGAVEELESLLGLILAEKKVHIVSSCTTALPRNKDVEARLTRRRENIQFHYAEDNTLIGKIKQLHEILDEIRAKRIFLYHSHHDITILAALQDNVVDELYLAGYLDHGLNPGIGHPLITAYMYNRPWQASYYKKYLHIPENQLWNMMPFLLDEALPPRATFEDTPKTGHIPIRSAVLVARSYKLFSKYVYPYPEILTDLLSRHQNMIHHHFGPLSDGELKKIHHMLADKNIAKDRFVHIPWFDLKEGINQTYGINLYLQSWPIGGARAAVSAMAEGLPLIQHMQKDSSQFSSFDYVYDEAPVWETPQELADILNQIDSDFLKRQSELSFKYFQTHYTQYAGLARYSSLGETDYGSPSINLEPFNFMNFQDLLHSKKLNAEATLQLFLHLSLMLYFQIGRILRWAGKIKVSFSK